jgi:beta-lactamase superfamily II metal-dependent hydrolase
MQIALGPVRLEVLHPAFPFLHKTHSDPNNNSIVLRLEVGGSRVLLSGDAEAEAEAALADQDVRADVLKVGHHGSAFSTGDAWLDRVQPRLAVISCGRHNSFGHPSPVTLERLRRHGVRTYRTDRDGAVTLELRPEGWTASTMLHK